MSRQPRAFISHHHSQAATAKHLKAQLAKHGIFGWLGPDDVDPGRAFDEAIVEEIAQTDAILLLFCAKSDRSRHVKREIILAEKASKPIIPVRLENIAPEGLAYFLQDYQWVEWFEQREEKLERLVKTIKGIAGVPVAEPEPVVAHQNPPQETPVTSQAELSPEEAKHEDASNGDWLKTFAPAFFVLAPFAVLAIMLGLASGEPDEEAMAEPSDVGLYEGQNGSGAVDPQVQANGTVIEVQMLTRVPSGGLQGFSPSLVKANVGDTIRFVPTDPTHQVASIDGMLPDGVPSWEGELNQEYNFVVPREGVFGFRCVPHYAAGMVGLIITSGIGGGDNLEEARRVSHPGLAARDFEDLFREADERELTAFE